LLPSFFGNLKQQKMNKKQVVYQKTNEAKKWNNVAIHIHLTKNDAHGHGQIYMDMGMEMQRFGTCYHKQTQKMLQMEP
jgi:hypothetical protein